MLKHNPNATYIMDLTAKDYQQLAHLPLVAFGFLIVEKKINVKTKSTKYILTFKTSNFRDLFQQFLKHNQINSRKIQNTSAKPFGNRLKDDEQFAKRISMNNSAMEKLKKTIDLPETTDTRRLERYLNLYANLFINHGYLCLLPTIKLHNNNTAQLYLIGNNNSDDTHLYLYFNNQIEKNIPYQLTSYRSLLTTRTLTSENLDKFIVPNLIGTLDFAHEKQRFDNISSDVENIRQMINNLNDGKLNQQVTWVNALPF